MRRYAVLVGIAVVLAAGLQAGAARAAHRAGAAAGGVDLDAASIPELQAAMRDERLSATALTDVYLDRIVRLNPLLRAVITVNPDAAALAAASDRRIAHGSRRRLEGIPVLLKDNIDTADRQPTTAGSLALLGARPARDATIVSRLRRAGAVIIGKANLSEWANFRSTASLSGWSGAAGQTHNPYVLDRDPCGSSSGSAVGVAAGLATVAIGTETLGSLMCPGSVNGVVAVKPTVGLASRAGIVPISPAQDTAGPMTRSVGDAAIVLSVIQGTDPRDRATADARPYAHRDLTQALRPGALRGARIGVWSNLEGAELQAIVDDAAATLRRAGAVTVPVEIDEEPLFEPDFNLLVREFKPSVNAYLAATPGVHPPDLAGLIDFNRRFATLELPLFGQEIFELAQTQPDTLDDPAYRAERARVTALAAGLVDDTLAAKHLDAIMGPAYGPAPVLGAETTTCTDFGDAYGPAAVAGYPNVTVPAATACGGLPVGMSFFAGRFDEPTVLAFAAAFERRTRARRAPAFLPTLPAASAATAQAQTNRPPRARIY